MLKTCFVCGAKENKLFEGMCEACVAKNHSPVKELKPLNLKLCNMCRKVHFQNQLYLLEEFEEMLPNIMKKRIKLNDNYILKEIKIENYHLEADNLVFDVEVDCDLKS